MTDRNTLLRALFAEAKTRGITSEQLREEISAKIIHKRLSAANPIELSNLLDHLKGKRSCRLCRPRVRREKLPDDIIRMVSPQQIALIEHLRADVRWRFYDGYFRWLRNHMHIEDRIKTSLEAARVIEALKNMLRSQQLCGSGNPACSLAADAEEAAKKALGERL